jgi:hypothetical protein
VRRARRAGEKEEGERGPGARGTSQLATTLFGHNDHIYKIQMCLCVSTII